MIKMTTYGTFLRISMALGAAVIAAITDVTLFTTGMAEQKNDIPGSGIIAQDTPDNPRNGEGALMSLRDGRLLLVYTQWYTKRNDDHAPAKLVAVTSDDGGRTWSLPVVVQENIGEMNVMSASLVRTISGKILLMYIRIDSNRLASLWMKESMDEAQMWSDPKPISKVGETYIITVNSSAACMKSGRIILPAYKSPGAWSKDEHYVASTYYSDDEGGTWSISASVVDCPKRGAMEPVVIELSDGRLMMLIRTQMCQVYRAYSSDGGMTWGSAEPSSIVHPEAPVQVARIPESRDLILVWNNAVVPGADHQGPRRPLTIAVSNDDGKTWRCLKNLESADSGSYCYVTLAFHRGELKLAYYAPGGLKFQSVPLDYLRRP